MDAAEPAAGASAAEPPRRRGYSHITKSRYQEIRARFGARLPESGALVDALLGDMCEVLTFDPAVSSYTDAHRRAEAALKARVAQRAQETGERKWVLSGRKAAHERRKQRSALQQEAPPTPAGGALVAAAAPA